jgi:hypothetical protein
MTIIHVDFRRRSRPRLGATAAIVLAALAANAFVWCAVPWAIWLGGHR